MARLLIRNGRVISLADRLDDSRRMALDQMTSWLTVRMAVLFLLIGRGEDVGSARQFLTQWRRHWRTLGSQEPGS